MSDGLDLFDNLSDDDYDDRRRTAARRGGRRPTPPPKRRRSRKGRWLILLVSVCVIIGGAYFGVRQVLGLGYYQDYTGSGTTDVVFQVNSGDSVRTIGNELQQTGVVASANAFVKASKSNDKVGNVQPGYYQMKEHMSGAAAVAKLVASGSRVGELEIRSGTMLNDTTATNGVVTSGILAKIAKATCATLNGRSTCVSAADLLTAITNDNPVALGVPSWAVPQVTAAQPSRKLEGLLMPAIYNIKPGDNATQVLATLLTQSSGALLAAGLPSSAQQSSGFTPYQVLTIASIVEREAGTAADMPKIARVVYNRLAQGMDLGLDSTVDYALDRPEVRTAAADQTKAGLYDTYHLPGLPPTPISSPSNGAIQAALAPTAGPWLYFVVCQKDHSSCFATTLNDQDANARMAQANGVY
ncbi:MAG TPA: endolytic transglycosylase MltG [Pseudonocardiaceae bacterium]|jgi:UPF0755 protein|nr:endolytic transglycosylase MltG [Pseudonocardiaceae bacterium]